MTEGGYTGHPSCTTCKVDYLGNGTCGACLYVRNLRDGYRRDVIGQAVMLIAGTVDAEYQDVEVAFTSALFSLDPAALRRDVARARV